MEQLANMPVWAQILSMGSFMFASGVLMTRIPLAPAIILSFFYLYGAFNTTHHMPSFTLQHPWIWMWVHIGLAGILMTFLLVSIPNDGPDGAGIVLGSLSGLVLGTIAILWLVSLLPAFGKWVVLLRSVPIENWQIYVWVLLFAVGIVTGIFSMIGLKTATPSFFIFQVFGVALGAIIICIGSLSYIFWSTKLLGILGEALSLVIAVIIVSITVCHYHTQHIHSKILSVLLEAVETGNSTQVRQLLSQSEKNGAYVNVRTTDGATLLMIASQAGSLSVVEELLQAGAEINATDKHRDTALVYALLNDYPKIASRLIQAGADVNIRSNSGDTALNIAREKGYSEIVELLKSAGAKE